MSAVVPAFADDSPFVEGSVRGIPRLRVIRVVLSDVHTIAALPLRALLADAEDVRVIAEATRARAAALAARLVADVIICELATSGARGHAAIRELASAATPVPILVMSEHADDEWLLGAIEAGAAGIVSRHASRSEILNAVRAIVSDQVILPRGVITALSRRSRANERKPRGASPDALRRLALLTGRERSVFRLIAEGFSAPEIGVHLSISKKTVETYKKRIGEKLGFSHRSEYVRFALDMSVLTSPLRDVLPFS